MKFRRPVLGEEAEALRHSALAQAGRTDEARRRASLHRAGAPEQPDVAGAKRALQKQ